MLSESQIRNMSIAQLSTALGLNIKRLQQGKPRNGGQRYVICDDAGIVIGYLGSNRKEVSISLLSCFSADELKKGELPQEERALYPLHPEFDLDEYQERGRTDLGNLKENKNSVANLTEYDSLADYIRNSYTAKVTGDY